jgi:hypothetical protein
LNDVIFQDLPTFFFLIRMPVVGKEITDMSGTCQSDRCFGQIPVVPWSNGVPGYRMAWKLPAWNVTLWLFNIVMENGPFIDGLPIKNGDFPWLC